MDYVAQRHFPTGERDRPPASALTQNPNLHNEALAIETPVPPTASASLAAIVNGLTRRMQADFLKASELRLVELKIWQWIDLIGSWLFNYQWGCVRLAQSVYVQMGRYPAGSFFQLAHCR